MRSGALPKSTVKTRVKQAIESKSVVGYDLKHDLEALDMQNNRSAKWVDLVDYKVYGKKGLKESVEQNFFNKICSFLMCRSATTNQTLEKVLAAEHLGKNIRQNTKKGHSSIEDARITMELYKRLPSNNQ